LSRKKRGLKKLGITNVRSPKNHLYSYNLSVVNISNRERGEKCKKEAKRK
jgi:hypothetical protein